MSLATEAIADLDAELADSGEWVELVRPFGTQQIPIKAKVRAFVRGYSPNELVGGITQSDSKVIISSTDITRQGWPGPTTVTAQDVNQDRRIPRKGDKVVIRGKLRAIEAGVGIYVADELVRIEVRVLG